MQMLTKKKPDIHLLISDSVISNKEGYFIMIKGSVEQKDTIRY